MEQIIRLMFNGHIVTSASSVVLYFTVSEHFNKFLISERSTTQISSLQHRRFPQDRELNLVVLFALMINKEPLVNV